MRGSGERLHGMQEVSGSIPLFSTIQFVLEPDSLRKRVRVRFLFIGGFAERVRRAVNEQRQDITIRVVSCLLLVWEFRLVRKFLVYVEKPFFL